MRLTLTTGDFAGAMDTVLSLKTTSQMVGAERLAGLALDMERSLRHDSSRADPAHALPRLAAAQLSDITTCAHRTTHVLRVHLRKAH